MKRIQLEKEAIHQGNLILVNHEYAYAEQGTLTFLPAYIGQKDILIEKNASVMLNQLMSEIDGWNAIVPVSGWRSCKEQQEIWNDSLTANGLEFTKKYVAVPKHSEHHTGLAIDLGLRQEKIDFICPDFPYTGICQIFRRRASHYGFVERYPKDKESITKIAQEPWHFRYVGMPHSLIMTEKMIALEEYLLFIKEFQYGVNPYFFQIHNQKIAVSYIAYSSNVTELLLEDCCTYTISGNNVDGFIFTEWLCG